MSRGTRDSYVLPRHRQLAAIASVPSPPLVDFGFMTSISARSGLLESPAVMSDRVPSVVKGASKKLAVVQSAFQSSFEPASSSAICRSTSELIAPKSLQ